jgi:alpha-L-rhamnosidase
MNRLLFTFFAILLFLSAASFAQKPSFLRCEYLIEPLGVDASSPRLTWLLDDARHAAIQTAYRIIVSTDYDDIEAGIGNVWDTGKVQSDKMLVAYTGAPLQPRTIYYWQVRIWDKDGIERTSQVAKFETGLMNTTWNGDWISDGHGLNGRSIHVREAPYFRKEFATQAKQVKSARAYIAVAGLYELYINGEKIGDHRLDPMYTRFDRRNLYLTHDITEQMQQGENAVGVLLGNGWYNHQSTAVWFFDRAPWRDRPTFCMDIHITYTDGTSEIVATDRSWRTALSPVIFNSIYTAEHYDGRREMPGWNKVGFTEEERRWRNSLIRQAPSQNIVSQQLHPIRNVERIVPQSIKQLNDTTWIYDLGRNIAGVSEFKISGEEGTVIRLRHSEMVQDDGFPDMRNIVVHYRPTDDSDPFQTDIFILGGGREETFMPCFNYKGFQYVEVTTSQPMTLSINNLTAWFMHSDVPPIGKLETSNRTINRMWWAANNSYLSNLHGFPTDCPQREKNGWTGDAHIAIEMALYNFDGITVYEKWLADHRDEQQPNGTLPSIIPSSGWGYEWGNGPDWTSSIAIIPWQIYLFYGDDRLLVECYDNIRRYVNRITQTANNEGLTSWGLGDWIPVKSQTPVEFTSSVYYYVSTNILAKAAKMFGKTEDYQKYSALANKIRNAINNKYFDYQTATYVDGMQTQMSVPLQWNVAPDDMRSRVAANLSRRVEADNKHLDVGLLGTKAILNALSENGYADLAYTVAAQETFPSWGYWIANGATTFYENWDITARAHDLSLNHIMFGEVSAWFFKALGGIKPDPSAPGFKNTILRPHFVKGLDHARVSFQSPYGEIISAWERRRNVITYRITIPANSTADLYLPQNLQLRRATLADGRTNANIAIGNNGAYKLVSGSYVLELR